MANDGQPSAFDLAAEPEPGPRRNGESRWQWLERSSEPVAVDIRTRWDRWLALMPSDSRGSVVSRLQGEGDDQVEAALAELVTFVLLHQVYPTVEVDPVTASGSQPDFAVRSPTLTYVEVHRITQSTEAKKDAQRRRDVAEVLERIESPDFWLVLDVELGPQVPSMRGPRHAAERLLASLDYEAERSRLDQSHQARNERLGDDMPGLDSTPQERADYFALHAPYAAPSFESSGEGWRLHMTAIPRSAEGRGSTDITIGIRTAGEAHLATVDGMQEAVRKKRRQHSVTEPLVVVLDLSSPIVSDEEIVAMLYGPLVAHAGTDGELTVRRDRKQGTWPDPVTQPARPAAVLILRGVWLHARDATAELWLPPAADSPLLRGPWRTLTLGADGQPVEVAPAAMAVADCLN